jgi:hypothetical protein
MPTYPNTLVRLSGPAGEFWAHVAVRDGCVGVNAANELKFLYEEDEPFSAPPSRYVPVVDIRRRRYRIVHGLEHLRQTSDQKAGQAPHSHRPESPGEVAARIRSQNSSKLAPSCACKSLIHFVNGTCPVCQSRGRGI